MLCQCKTNIIINHYALNTYSFVFIKFPSLYSFLISQCLLAHAVLNRTNKVRERSDREPVE